MYLFCAVVSNTYRLYKAVRPIKGIELPNDWYPKRDLDGH